MNARKTMKFIDPSMGHGLSESPEIRECSSGSHFESQTAWRPVAPLQITWARSDRVPAGTENDRTEHSEPAHVEAHEITPSKETLVRIESIAAALPVEKGENVDRNEPFKDRPEVGKVIAAASHGKTQILRISREAVRRPLRYEVSESLVPPGAATHEIATADADGESSQQTPSWAWARIVAEKQQPPPKEVSAQSNETSTSGLHIQSLLGEYTGPFALTIAAESVPPAKHKALLEGVEEAWRAANGTLGQEERAKKLEATRDSLAKALGTALVREMVAVSAPDENKLGQVVGLVAGAVLPKGQRTWSEEINPETGQVKLYANETSALHTEQKGLAAYLPAQDFAGDIRYPSSEVPGVAIAEQHTFAANRSIPAGEPSVQVANIVDNQGHIAGELHVPEKDFSRHSLMVASSGSGKTVAIREIIARKAAADYEKSKNHEGAPAEQCAIVVVDFEKTGNYAQQLAGTLAGMGLPQNHSTVHRVTPGGKEARANINLLRLTGNTPEEQIAIATKTLASGIKEDEAHRVFTKYTALALELTYKQVGWNLKTGESRYPHGQPPIPDMDMVTTAIETVINSSAFRNEAKGDLGSYVTSQLRETLRGIPGRLFQEGYDIDWQKVLKADGVTVIELGKMVDPTAKKLAMTAIFRGLAAVLDAQNPEGDGDHLKALLVMDETGGMFDCQTEPGIENAHFFTSVRGKGLGCLVALQGNLGSLHPDVLVNTHNVWALHVTGEDDRRILASRMGNTTPEQLKYLSAVPPGGRGLYYGGGMPNGPVRFVTTNPRELPKGEGKVVGPYAITDLGADQQHYAEGIKPKAKELLQEAAIGNLIQSWAEVNAILVPMGRAPAKVGGDLKTALRTMEGKDALVRDSAIAAAVTRSVTARPAIMHAMKWEDLTKYLVDNMLAQVQGQERPPENIPRLDLALNVGRYSPVVDEVVNAMTAPRLPDSPRYEKVLGQLYGTTAQLQLEQLPELEEKALNNLLNIMTTTAQSGSADANATIQARAELAKLIAGAPDAAEVEQAIHKVCREKLHELGLEPAFELLPATTEDAEVSIPRLRQALTQSIETYRQTAAIDLSRWEAIYGEQFTGKTAHEQLESIHAKEQAMLARSGYQLSEAEKTDLFIAPDFAQGGFIIDNTIASFMQRAKDRGSIYSEQEKLHNQGREEDVSLLALLKKYGDNGAGVWGKTMAEAVLYSRNFEFEPGASRFLVEQFNNHIQALKKINRINQPAR